MQRDVTVVKDEWTIRAGHIDAADDEEVVGRMAEDEEWFDCNKAEVAAQTFLDSPYEFYVKFTELPSGTQRIEGV